MSEKRPAVLYHNDADGFTAAWAAWKKFGQQADYLPVEYGEPIPEGLAGREVFILDFCYPAEVIRDLLRCPDTRVTVIDHHTTTADRLERLVGSSLVITNNLWLVYDEKHAACWLAWHYFHRDDEVPPLVLYVEDRDLWKFELPDSRLVNAWLSIQERSFEYWEVVCRRNQRVNNQLLWQGEAIVAVEDKQIDYLCSLAQPITLFGYQVLAVNTATMRNEVAGRLAVAQAFGVCWYLDGWGLVRWSLRSREGGIDVSKLSARIDGGGGHPRAAGFETDLAFLVNVLSGE